MVPPPDSEANEPLTQMTSTLSHTEAILGLIKKWALTFGVPASAIETLMSPEHVAMPMTEAMTKPTCLSQPLTEKPPLDGERIPNASNRLRSMQLDADPATVEAAPPFADDAPASCTTNHQLHH